MHFVTVLVLYYSRCQESLTYSVLTFVSFGCRPKYNLHIVYFLSYNEVNIRHNNVRVPYARCHNIDT